MFRRLGGYQCQTRLDIPEASVRMLDVPAVAGVVLFLGVVTMEKDRLPTVILLIFCVLAIILAECVVCLLGGDL